MRSTNAITQEDHQQLNRVLAMPQLSPYAPLVEGWPEYDRINEQVCLVVVLSRRGQRSRCEASVGLNTLWESPAKVARALAEYARSTAQSQGKIEVT